MPSPEKFRESLEKFEIDPGTIHDINEGYEELVSSTPRKVKAAYFKRAMDILDERVEPDKKRDLIEWNACCKSGARDKASRAFAKRNAALSFEERAALIAGMPNMGEPELNPDGTLTLHAVYYRVGDDKFGCGCPTFRGVKRDYPVSSSYCLCCGGHFKYHYEIMLGVELKLLEVVSTPLDSGGANPCVFRYAVVRK